MASILIIDDDTQIRHLLSEVLTREGHDVLEASNGRDGLRVLEENPVNIVITDIVMPEQEGLETIHEIRRDQRDTKIVAMSAVLAKYDFDYLPAAEMIGADRTIKKPFLPDDIVRIVQDLLTE